MCLRAAVVRSIIDTGLILGTCVVKPDYCRGNDWLGISHCVTHRCSSQKAHVHRIKRERKKERTRGRAKQEGDGKMIRKHRGERGIPCPQESDDNNYMEGICETNFFRKKQKQGERN